MFYTDPDTGQRWSSATVYTDPDTGKRWSSDYPDGIPSLSSLHDIAPLGRRGAFRDTLRPGRFR